MLGARDLALGSDLERLETHALGGGRLEGGLIYPPELFDHYGAAGFYLDAFRAKRTLTNGLNLAYQDDEGTTAVAVTTDPAGLILDESEGAALGAELVTNGGFDTDTSWTKSSTTISGGVAVFSSTTGNIEQDVALSANKHYRLTYTISGYSAGTVQPRFTGGSPVIGIARNENGTFTEFLLAVADVNLRFAASGTTTLNIDDVSLVEVSGNHASQSTDANRLIYTESGALKYYVDSGLSNFMETGLAPALAGTTIAVCCRITGTNDQVIGASDAAFANECFLGIDASGFARFFFTDAANPTGSTDLTAEDVVLLGRGNASTAEVFVNGASIATDTPDAGMTSNPFYLGAINVDGTGNNHMAGRIYRAFAIQAYLNDSDILPLMRALGSGVVSF